MSTTLLSQLGFDYVQPAGDDSAELAGVGAN